MLEKEDMVLEVEWEEKVGEKHFPGEDQRVEKDYPHRFNDYIEKPRVRSSIQKIVD